MGNFYLTVNLHAKYPPGWFSVHSFEGIKKKLLSEAKSMAQDPFPPVALEVVLDDERQEIEKVREMRGTSGKTGKPRDVYKRQEIKSTTPLKPFSCPMGN